jgi:hypothetical protein
MANPFDQFDTAATADSAPLGNPFDKFDPPKDLSWGDVASQAVENTPSSALQLAKDTVQPILHPIDTAKSLGSIAVGAAQKVIPGIGYSYVPYADAVGEHFKNRYGSVEGFKNTLATDPVGAAADAATILTGGAAAADRIPGIAGSLTKAVSTVGNLTDPFRVPVTAAKAVDKVATPVLGGLSGVGPTPLREAAAAGYEGGSAAKSFWDHYTETASPVDAVRDAREAVSTLRKARNDSYQQDMAQIGQNLKPLRFNAIDQAMDDANQIKTFRGSTGNAPPINIAPSTNDVQAQLSKIVNDWGALDPNEYHTATGLDALKQRIGDVKDNLPYNTPQRLAAQKVYTAVRNTIAREDPRYNSVMKGYEDASNQIDEVARTLSVNPKASVDTTLRKLQSALRNNVNTNYGNRTKLVQDLADAGAPNLMPKLAGQALTSVWPRGISGVVGGGDLLLATYAHNPFMLSLLPFQSPKVLGALYHGAGRAAGYVANKLPSISVPAGVQSAVNPALRTSRLVGDAGQINPQDQTQPQRALGGRAPLPFDDGGANQPEKRETLQAQHDQVLHGHKPAVMFPKGTEEAKKPEGLQRTTTERGTFHYNPNQISKTSIQDLSKIGHENEVLGLGPFSKSDIMQRIQSGEKPVAIVERKPDGTEVKAAVGTDKTAPEQLAHFERTKTPGNTVKIEKIEDVVKGRFASGGMVQRFDDGGAATPDDPRMAAIGIHPVNPDQPPTPDPAQAAPSVPGFNFGMAGVDDPTGQSESPILKKLFGLGGEERYQTWPEKMVRSGASLAHDMMSGETNYVPGLRREDVTDKPPPSGPTEDSTALGRYLNLPPVAAEPNDEVIERAQDMAGLAGVGGVGGAGEEAGAALGSGPMLRPALKYNDKIYKAPVGGEHLDALPPELANDFHQKALSGDDINDYQFGFLNHKGQFLNREDALDYGIREGLIDPRAGKYGALTSTLLSDSSKPGAALTAAERYATQDAYHGTPTPGFAKFNLPDAGQYMPDRALGIHVSKDPAIADTFVKDNGAVYPLKVPPDEKFYPVKQDLLPYIEDKSAPKSPRNVISDQNAVETEIYRNAYRQDPEMFARFLEQRWNLPKEAAETAAQNILVGKPQRLLGREVVGLDDYIQHDGVVKAWNEPDRAKAVQLFKKDLQGQGYAGIKYINTSPMETANAKDPTSYVVFDPSKDIRSRLTGTLMSDTSEPASALSAVERLYSPVERALQNAPQQKMQPSQWLGWLKNQPGVKAEELETLGIADPSGMPVGEKGLVNKADLLQQVKTNGLKLNEVVKTNSIWDLPQRERDRLIDSYADQHDMPPSRVDTTDPDFLDFIGGSESHSKVRFGPDSHPNLSLPGGDQNYRETLLTLPVREDAVIKRAKQLAEAENGAGSWGRIGGGGQQHYIRDASREIGRIPVDQQEYRSSHYPDDPNVVVHTRTNDRVIDGAKTLHMEENQSDAHQQGADVGYKPSEQERAAAAEKIKVIRQQQQDLLKSRLSQTPDGKWAVKMDTGETVKFPDRQSAEQVASMPSGQVRPKWIELEDEATRLGGIASNQSGKVPDMPFKGMQNWSNLALKHTLARAVNEDKDAISWTPGEAQAERYDLSKQIESLKATPVELGKGLQYEIRAIAKGGTSEPINKVVDEADLPNVVGKDMAKKIIEQTGGKKPVKFTGLDLKVGGEFHKKLYDNVMVKNANAIGKKYGAKVEYKDLRIDDRDVSDGAFRQWARQRGQNVNDLSESDHDELLTQFEEERGLPEKKTVKVPFMRITPALREHIKTNGLPLFSDTTKPGAALSANEYPDQNKIPRVPAQQHNPDQIGRAHGGRTDKKPTLHHGVTEALKVARLHKPKLKAFH